MKTKPTPSLTTHFVINLLFWVCAAIVFIITLILPCNTGISCSANQVLILLSCFLASINFTILTSSYLILVHKKVWTTLPKYPVAYFITFLLALLLPYVELNLILSYIKLTS